MAVLAALVTAVAVGGIWLNQRSEEASLGDPETPGGLFLASQAAGTPLAAAGRTRGLAGPCTAWLLDVGAGQDSPAFAVTAGRCVGVTDSATVLSGEPVAGATVEFNAFARVTSSGELSLVPAEVEQVVWASARWTDLALLRLGASYRQLADSGIRPISPTAAPAEGTELLVASVPVRDVPADEQFLRGSRCVAGQPTDVVESGLLWRDLRATDCDGILTGSHGAPVFNEAGEAVAMVASTTIAGGDGPPCSEGLPCEVRDGDVQPVRADTTYVLPVEGLADCIADAELTLADGCPLEDPRSVVVAVAESASGAPGSTVRVDLDPSSSLPEAGVADLSGTLGGVDCFEQSGWSAPTPAAQWSLALALPTEPGWALACVGSPEQPTPVVVEATSR
jgi:hypothetical protein